MTKTKKYITTTGYYGTGSSAVTDMLLSHDKVSSLGDFEFKFLQDINGISDLEFRFVENHHRHNSGHALKLYKRYSRLVYGPKFKKGYSYFFGKRWIEESDKYISNLTSLVYKGYYNQDLLELGKFRYYIRGFFNTIGKKTRILNKEGSFNLLPREKTYVGKVEQEQFYIETRKYIDALFESEKFENSDYIFIDQAIPPSNVKRYNNYFDDLKVFVVDRDPRDIFILEKHIWKTHRLPIKDVEEFCIWYETTRNHRDTEVYEENVMFLYFEELIYKYEETKSKIEKFLNLENINEGMKHFDPLISIKNTKLWEKYPKEKENINIIEKKLGKYLYKTDK